MKSIIAGQQSQSVYMDVRQLAQAAAVMVDDILNERESEVDNSADCDNGVKLVPAVLLQPLSVDKTNYDVLVQSEYITADQLK
ncbi:hypothetical protein ACFYZU_33900 [Streptomyces sp. NPDC001651]|uniref:hypothetical protein n=1 Tax=Streptomyces sp. NPDC001651 TaxID=3364596 RepID=UPI0036C04B3D